MYFQVCDHYDEKNNCPMNDCFICMEYKSSLGEHTIELTQQSIYAKPCTCNGWIHAGCLDNWIAIKKRCPICRRNVHYIYYKRDYNGLLHRVMCIIGLSVLIIALFHVQVSSHAL